MLIYHTTIPGRRDMQKIPEFDSRMSAEMGDITTYQVDAIVNAANTSLLGGGGVDGAIHRAAGPQLLEACRKLAGCTTGDAKVTAGYRLPARFVIHTVGPVWQGGSSGEDHLLASCYRRSLEVAQQAGARSIAFPAISTGVYRFPPERAAEIAINTVHESLADIPDAVIRAVLFVCFSRKSYEIYQRLL
jgi:O-acetyl-ADP-ribose deacetylase (regulator of RNase III)